jgi:AraC-like DNA-binding protein
MQDVAQALGQPVRTLQHRLGIQGQRFKDIKDRVRADLAMKYLRHSQLGLSEIAEILGYSELSAFSRSFRRWHGRPAQSVRHETRDAGGGRTDLIQPRPHRESLSARRAPPPRG